MTSATTAPVVDDETGASGAAKLRDADHTRRLLLSSARRRFAHSGYATTTVREIAADAGVNVALINRYFTSKEGLFQACLERAVEDLDRTIPATETVEETVNQIVKRVTASPTGEHHLQMLLLLRTSGDDGAEIIRRDTFRSFAERMARVFGWEPGDPGTEHIMLRAQVAMSAAFGIILLQSTSGLEPLTSATEDDLRGPLGDVIRTLLAP